MTILVDVDDVLNNLVECWIENLNKRSGSHVKPEDIVDWDIRQFFPTLTAKEIYNPLNDIEFWKSVKPKQDAQKYLKMLLDEKHNIYLCTSTYYKNIQSKFEHFLKKHYPFITWDKVIIAKHKQMIKADILIDDAIHNLVYGDYVKILFDAPHNQGVNAEKYGIVRAKNWEEVYKIIGGLNK